MHSETGAQNTAVTRKTSRPSKSSQTEVAGYIGDIATELEAMARRSGLKLLAYLLSMTALHAKELQPRAGGKSSKGALSG